MRNFDENTITDAVLERLSGARSDRIRRISEALVRHAHDFVREVELSQEEWLAGVEFLTQVGKMCNDKRQEFILLSDTLGVSMLVDAINNRFAVDATETTVLGPFYVQGPPEHELGADISAGVEGEPLLVSGTVRSAAGTALPGALVDVWHSDEDGFYDMQRDGDLVMRARLRTDGEGRFHFRTVMPAAYPIPTDGPVGAMLEAQGRHPYRPAHVHFMIAAPGHRTLVTHIFVAGDDYLDSDAVFGVKDSLVREFERIDPEDNTCGRGPGRSWRRLRYDFALAPDGTATARRE